MNAQDILELLRGGYTKADIDALMNGQPVQDGPADDPSTGPDPAPASDPAPDLSSGADKPEWASALEASIVALTKTMQTNALEANIAALTKTMQANARMNDEQPDEQPDEPANAADIALATYMKGRKSNK